MPRRLAPTIRQRQQQASEMNEIRFATPSPPKPLLGRGGFQSTG
jgi:hypothetical protein